MQEPGVSNRSANGVPDMRGAVSGVPRIDTSFAQAVEILRRRMPELFVPDADVDHVRTTFRKHGRSASRFIDYDRYALGFNRAYFFKNLYKCLTVLSHTQLDLPQVASILDIGAGGGVFSTAWRLLFPSSPVRTLLIDKSPQQLRIAKHVTAALQLPSVTCRVGVYPEDFECFEGLRLFSYWFCEQIPGSGDAILPQSEAWLGEQNLIIDYEDVLSDVIRILPREAVYEIRPLTVYPPLSLHPLFNDDHFSASSLFVRLPSKRSL